MNEKVEYVNAKTDLIKKSMLGIDKIMFKYGIPEMMFEQQESIDRIIEGVRRKERYKTALQA